MFLSVPLYIYALDPRFGLGILCYCDGFIPCPLQNVIICYDAVDGLGTDCPSCWTEDPDARSAPCRQSFLEALEDAISRSVWGVLDQLGYFSSCLEGVFHQLALF